MLKESKRIPSSHIITSLIESISIENQNQMELYQTISARGTINPTIMLGIGHPSTWTVPMVGHA
jgi:hypothetical protein